MMLGNGKSLWRTEVFGVWFCVEVGRGIIWSSEIGDHAPHAVLWYSVGECSA